MKPMMSHHSPAIHQQPLLSFVTVQVGLDTHFTHKDQEEIETKLKKYIQPHTFLLPVSLKSTEDHR